MYHFEKADKKLLGAQIEDELMNFILQEPVAVGEKIPNEFELAEKFGVGRSTIREAVKGLVSKGILEVKRGSGTFVVSACTAEDAPRRRTMTRSGCPGCRINTSWLWSCLMYV